MKSALYSALVAGLAPLKVLSEIGQSENARQAQRWPDARAGDTGIENQDPAAPLAPPPPASQ